MIPKNTEQYIMWYTYNNITDNEITSDINELLENFIKELRSQIKNNLVELSRAKKAAKSYE